MDEPFDGDQAVPAAPSRGPRDRTGKYPIARAALVCGAFVIGAVLLLATIHPSKPTVVAGAVVTTTSTTTTANTSGTAPTTTAVTTTTTTHPRHGHHPTTTTTTVPVQAPANVPALVANGSGVTGAAAAFTARLKSAGWTTLPPTNTTTQVSSSHVYYGPGQQAAAATAAAQLHIPASSVAPYSSAVPVSTIGTAQVIVVLGPDIASSSTTTTSAGSSSTTIG
ncbi:MAG: LytR C-terminal domain-containing protein [Acidimicrobiales bacterium]|nr:LytR C-terminal domain-containing protein [Acidimicrobiales bacterium]